MAAQQAMYIIDEDYRILYMNEVCKAYFPSARLHDKCYHALAQCSGLCQHCPVVDAGGESACVQERICAQAIPMELPGDRHGYAIIFEAIGDGQQGTSSALGLQDPLVQQQNLELEYIKHRRPDAFHSCHDEKGFPFREISQPFCELLGYDRNEIETQFHNMLLEMVVPEDRMKLLSVHKMEEIGATMQLQYRICTKSRGVIWVKGTVRLSEFGGERFYQATVVEITDEIKRQLELKQKNRELELILSAIPGGLKHIQADENYTFRFLSEEAAALFGYTVDEMLSISGGSALNMVYEEDRENVRNMLQQCLAHNTEYTVRHRIKCKDGRLKYVMSCGRLAEDDDETPYFQSLYIDFTREKENEDMLQQLQLIRALSNDYSDVFMVDLDTHGMTPVFQHESSRIVSMNNSCYDNWMKTFSENFLFAEDRSVFWRRLSIEGMQERLRHAEMYHHNYRNEQDGVISHWQIKCVRLGAMGETNKVIIGFRNVDDEVRTEEKRNMTLRNALLQAQYANKAKTTFLNNMSHDIRTPMNAIIVFAKLAATHIDHKDRVSDYLRKISQSSGHLLSLINDVLDMSRIEAGKMMISEKAENLSEILCEIRNIMQADVHSKQLNFDMNVLDVIDENVYCDKLRVKQILLNLLSNAVKFTPPGGTVAVKVQEKPSGRDGYAIYEFTIRDTGIGMEKAFMEHLFEPFVQERPSTLSGIQGTGLGMAITKNIVDLCGGTIHVNSEIGCGTEITVTLQLRLVADRKEIERIAMLEGKRALVVDDDMDACQSIARILRCLGMRVDWTVGGKEAVVRAEEAVEMNDPYSLYLIDWLMPDMNGIETARRLRKVSVAKTPMILLSAYDYADAEEEAQEAGICDFLCKPLFLSELRQVLLRVYGESAQEKPLVAIANRFVGKRVLVVEDTLLNQEISVDILDIAGVTAEIAPNGQIALEMLEQRGAGYYDMVFMDIQMPVMDGYEAARRIRSMQDEQLANIPIIAMTANAYEEDRVLSFKAGMNGHIGKPIDLNQLFALLQELIGS